MSTESSVNRPTECSSSFSVHRFRCTLPNKAKRFRPGLVTVERVAVVMVVMMVMMVMMVMVMVMVCLGGGRVESGGGVVLIFDSPRGG